VPQSPGDLTDEELARQNWEMLRKQFMNLPTSWDQLGSAQQNYWKAWVRELRQAGILPEFRPKKALDEN
jgi:hypothetical protein